MPEIKSFPFAKDKFDLIKNYKYGVNWPVVYVLQNKKEAYVGETTHLHSRFKQHFDFSEERRALNTAYVITDEEYNKSAALDIESWLIQYMSADGSYALQNGNGGLQNHKYYDRKKYMEKFELIWKELQAMGLVKKDLVQIRNSDLFKYSPYKSLTDDQLYITEAIFHRIKNNDKNAVIVDGRPGTGKTILAVYLVKYLLEQDATKNLRIGLVVPMTSLRSTLKKVFSSVKGLKASMVIGPGDVVRGDYDLLLVDEAHRLKRRVNLSSYAPFDEANKKLKLESGTELDWIMVRSKHQIFFYDKGQSVKPTDIRHEQMDALDSVWFELSSQLRIEDGDDYMKFIEELFNPRSNKKAGLGGYDFKMFDSVVEMIDVIKQKNETHKLSRVVAGYAWDWNTKDNPNGYDIEIDGLKMKWNSTTKDWINSENAINEVGCIHTVQGYDLNYVGVIIGPELTYDEKTNSLVVDSKKYKDFNGKRSIADPEELKRYIINIYKTMLARGIKGSYVYVVDEKLRGYFKTKTL